jgi:hypothetical protein
MRSFGFFEPVVRQLRKTFLVAVALLTKERCRALGGSFRKLLSNREIRIYNLEE